MSTGYKSRLFLWMVRRWVCTFALMGMAFVLFGVLSLNLIQSLSANIRFLADYGFMAIMDGGLWQLAELVTSAYGAIGFYVAFKTCEHALVERLAHHDNSHK